MSTQAIRDGAPGFTISFTTDDLAKIHVNGKTGKIDLRDLRALVGSKVMRMVLHLYHGVPNEKVDAALLDVELLRVSLLGSTRRRTSPLVKVQYRFPKSRSKRINRQVFYFDSKDGGLTGRFLA